MTGRAVLAGLRVLADYLRPGYTPAQPYQCRPAGHVITRLYGPQKAAIEQRLLAPCPRRGCGGLLRSASVLADLGRQSLAEQGDGYEATPW